MSQETTRVFKGKNKIIIETEQDAVGTSWKQVLSVSLGLCFWETNFIQPPRPFLSSKG